MAQTQQEMSRKCYQSRREKGLCPRCGKILDRKGYYCQSCLEKTAEYRKENRQFYKEHGICPVCGREKLFGDEKQCILCRNKRYEKRKEPTEEERKKFREYSRTWQKLLYYERKEKGICTRCGKIKTMAGKSKCGLCLEKDARAHRNRELAKSS